MKIGYRILVLLVACVLAFHVCTVPARATSLGAAAAATVVSVPAALAIGAVLLCLGICVGEAVGDWDQIVADCELYLESQGLVANGYMEMYQYNLSSGYRRAMRISTVEAIRAWLFGEGVLSETDSVTLGTSHSFSIDGTTHTITSYDPVGVVGFLLTYKQGTSYSYKRGFFGYAVSSFSNVRFSVDGKWQNSAYRDFLTKYVGHSHYYSELLFFSSQQREYDFNFGPFVTDGLCVYEAGPFASYDDAMAYVHSFDVFTGELSTNYDLTLNDVAGSAVSVEAGYPTWAENAVTIPGTVSGSGEDENALPLTVPPVGGNIHDITQEEAQAGTVTDVLDDPVPDTEDGVVTSAWLGEWLSKILLAIRSVVDFFPTVISGIQAIPGEFERFFDLVISGVQAIPGQFADWFDLVISGIRDVTGTLTEWFDLVISGIQSLPDTFANIYDLVVTKILDGIAAIFVPTEDYVSDKVMELAAYFPFVESVIATVDSFKGNLSASGPPVIYVDLGAAEGDVNWGGRAVLVDFAFYEEYKPRVDALISAALYAFFAWRVFVHLPGIIGGDSGVIIGNVIRSGGRSKSDEGE